MNENVKYSVWIAESLGQGNLLASKIAENFSAKSVYEGCLDEIEDDSLFTEDEMKRISKALRRRSLTHAEEIVDRCEKLGISIVTYESADYPSPLRTLRDMPVVLYVRGKLPDCNNNMLTAVVGTRSMTEYGRRIAYSLGAGLAFGGSIVVSGMALGADSMALIGALENGGRTIAVLGSGVDVIYPREHKEIYNRILSKGAVISEYPPGTPPSGSHFPVRNRIMSGLSDATVVVEADAKSGALITARNAVKQGRKLFAVPGKVGDPGAEGTNMLICDGAIPVTTAEDILIEFEFMYKGQISVAHAHSKLHGLDMNTLSSDAMYRARIGSSIGHSNYVGNGSYGGRLRSVMHNQIEPKHEDTSPAVNKPAQAKTQKNTQPAQVDAAVKKQKNEKTIKEPKKTPKKVIAAKKIELDLLDEEDIKVYNKMKPNVPTLPDELVDAETSISDIMSALPVLEMAGAVESGGGGYFMRVSEDDINESPND